MPVTAVGTGRVRLPAAATPRLTQPLCGCPGPSILDLSSRAQTGELRTGSAPLYTGVLTNEAKQLQMPAGDDPLLLRLRRSCFSDCVPPGILVFVTPSGVIHPTTARIVPPSCCPTPRETSLNNTSAPQPGSPSSLDSSGWVLSLGPSPPRTVLWGSWLQGRDGKTTVCFSCRAQCDHGSLMHEV